MTGIQIALIEILNTNIDDNEHRVNVDKCEKLKTKKYPTNLCYVHTYNKNNKQNGELT